MQFPSNLRYTKEHEWIQLNGTKAKVGITEFAQSELGDIVFVDIEKNGQEVASGDVFGTVEAVKTVSDLFSPLSGTITGVNDLLQNQPELVNTDPYGDGWMIEMEVSDVAAFETLMTAEEYAQLVQ